MSLALNTITFALQEYGSPSLHPSSLIANPNCLQKFGPPRKGQRDTKSFNGNFWVTLIWPDKIFFDSKGKKLKIWYFYRGNSSNSEWLTWPEQQKMIQPGSKFFDPDLSLNLRPTDVNMFVHWGIEGSHLPFHNKDQRQKINRDWNWLWSRDGPWPKPTSLLARVLFDAVLWDFFDPQ